MRNPVTLPTSIQARVQLQNQTVVLQSTESSTMMNLQAEHMRHFDDLKVKVDARVHLQHQFFGALLLKLAREMQLR